MVLDVVTIRSLKEAGLATNFLIDYNELQFIKKIGEGGN